VLNQQPCVVEGQKVKKGQVIADGGGTLSGESPRKNVLVAFMSWRDTLRGRDHRSAGLLRRDTYTSIHIEEFEIEIRETKLARGVHEDIPNVSEKALRNLDETGVIRSARASSPATCSSARSRRSQERAFPRGELLHAISDGPART